ncbi:uncharacterized protein [Ptychodera flava]|uniref:uncharacterized protein isoform X2 n=1 Tax=Ptychodera flava TaxID=63121 RepID=UPI00396A9ED0
MGRIYHHRVALLSGCILTVLLCHPVIGVPCEYGFENSTYLQQQMYFDGSFYGYAYCTDCLDPFQNLTACFWMKSNHTDTNGTVFTIFDSQGSEIRLQSYQFELCINHDCNSSAIKVADGSWHFVCSTWQSLEGEWQLYIDGVRVHQSLISSQANFEFLNLSALIIGQHWSYFVYDNSSDYHGYLTFFNLWPSVLDSLTMNELSTGCEYRLYQNCGDLFSWIVDANYLETSGSTVEVSQADNCYVGVPCNTPWGNSTYRDQQIGLDGWTASYVVCEECLVSSFQDLTACFWMKSNTTTNTSGAIFSVFDLWNNENKDIRLLDNSFRFCIKKNCDSSTIYVTDNDWHFVCSAWQSSDGEWRLYMDGVEVHRSLILPHVNSAFAEGLTLALGQDYSSFMFGNGSSYHGYLAFFNLWMDVLDIYTMNTLSTGCEYWYNQNCGNLFSWVHDGNHFQESYVDVSEAENCEYDPACGLPWANSTYRDQQIYFDQSSTSYVSCVGCLHHAFQNFTACFWMKSNNTDTNGTIFSIFDNSGETDDEIRLQSYHFKLCINNDCSASNSSSGSPVHAADGNWHFVCVMWQALHGEWRLYINGDDGYQSFIISQTNSTFPEGLSLVLGQSLSGLVNGNGGDGYYGYLAFFNLWSEIPSDIDFIGLSTAATGCYDDYQTVCGDLFSWVTDGNSFGLSSVEVSTADNCWFDESNCGAPWGYSAYGGEQIFFNGTSSNVLCEGCLDEAFQDFSACFWMRSNNTYTIGTVFSIFDSFGNTQDSIQLQSHSFELCINDDCETSAHHANDGEWHFVCSTWKSVSGDWRLYVDNIEVHHSSIPSQKSTTFASGLTLVLGTFVSGMVQDDGKGYHGYMTSFNLWNHVLGVAVIDTMDRFCVHRNPICGDLFSWQLDGNNFIVEYVDVFEDDRCAPPTALSSLPKSTTTSVAASSAVSTYSPTTVTALSPTVSSSPTTDLTTAIASSTQYSYTDITTSSENASGGHSSASHNSTLQTSSRTPQTSPGKTASKTNTTQSNGGHPGVTNSSSHTTNEKLANLEVEATNCSDVVSCNSVLTQLHDLLGNGQSDGESVNTEKAVTVFSQAINPQSLSSKDITKEEKLSVVETTIQTCGSLLDVTNGNLWSSDNSNEDDSSHLADLVVAMDTFTDGIMTYINTDLNVTISVQTDNIELQAKSVDIATIGNSSVSLGTDKSNITMPTSLWIDSGFTNVSVVFVHYKTLDQINSQLSNDVKSDVISLSATPLPEIPFAEDISITLQVEEVSTGSLVCGYLDYTTTPSEWKTDGCQATTSGDGQVTCDCNHMTNFALLMQMVDFEVSAPDSAALTWISRVGSVFSLIALVITFVVILLIRLSSDRAMILLNLCVSLFFAQLLFIVGAKAVSYEALCKTVAIALHYLFLVVFFWMLVEGIQLLTKVRNVMWRAKTTMIWYAVIGWVFPAVIVIITVGIRFEYYASGDSCWISQEDGVIFSFVGPVLAVIVINISVLVVVLRTFLSVKANAKKKDIEKIKASIRAAVVLVPLLGVTWIFGVFAISKQTIFFQYLFVILNSLQGVFIFIFHCLLNEEVKTSFRRKYRKGSKVGSKTGKTTGCNNESMTTTSTGTATSM